MWHIQLMRMTVVVFLLLGACSSHQMQGRSALANYPSVRGREVVTECLLNRLTTDNRAGQVERGDRENRITFGGMLGAVLSFTVRDAPNGGSVTEMRRLSSVTPGRTAAETCF